MPLTAFTWISWLPAAERIKQRGRGHMPVCRRNGGFELMASGKRGPEACDCSHICSTVRSMPHPPISVRLSDRTYAILSARALADDRSVGQLIRELAEKGAADLRRAQIRAESEAVSARYRSDPNVRDFYDEIAAVGSEALRSGLPEEERS